MSSLCQGIMYASGALLFEAAVAYGALSLVPEPEYHVRQTPFSQRNIREHAQMAKHPGENFLLTSAFLLAMTGAVAGTRHSMRPGSYNRNYGPK